MDKCSDDDEDDDDDDKHWITINKSKTDKYVAAEGENTLEDAFDSQIDKEPNDDIICRMDL